MMVSFRGADRELAMMQTLANAIARGRSTVLLLAVATAVLASAPIAAAEEAYPSRPIRLIVPFPPGGPTDVMGRLISQALSNELRQQVYVDNRPGAGSTLAGKIAANAEPDGYALLLGSAATLAIGPTLFHDVEYDPKRFEPVAMVAEVPYVMVASPKAPVASFAELMAYAKAHPGKLNFGVPNGAPPHMLAAWFKSLTNIDVVLVTYRGGANVLSDLLGGQIDLAVEERRRRNGSTFFLTCQPWRRMACRVLSPVPGPELLRRLARRNRSSTSSIAPPMPPSKIRLPKPS
jgi:tripartite-type tricarboxylate transporter receptor subunit TctC